MVVWFFLLGVVGLGIAVVMYIIYQVIAGAGGGTSPGAGTVSSPLAAPLSATSPPAASQADDRYVLYGAFFPEDQRYKIFKVYYRQFIREEVFSFPWKNAAVAPGMAAYGERIGIFPARDRGYFIRHDGSREDISVFVPPDEHAALSPDGSMMFYFKYLSSIGNPALAMRSMAQGEDAYVWSPTAAASALCEFAGWSPDGANAYCIAREGGTATVRAFSVANHTAAVVASARDVRDARYYPASGSFVVAANDRVSVTDTQTKEAQEVVRAPEGFSVVNAFLALDGSRVVYTVMSLDGVAGQVRTVSSDGFDDRVLTTGHGTRAVSVSGDGSMVLFEEDDRTNVALKHYFISDVEKFSPRELYAVDATAQDARFLGWFSTPK